MGLPPPGKPDLTDRSLTAEVAFHGLDLGVERPGNAGADIGLEREADPRRPRGDRVHDLVPVTLDRGEHGVGPAGQAALADDPDRIGDILRDVLADSERRDRERDQHWLSLMIVANVSADAG